MLARCCCAFLVVLAGCGAPVDGLGNQDATFTRASLSVPQPGPADPSRPLAADLAVEPLSMLVMFNRLHTADKIQEMINRNPGQFSRVDVDKDSAPDPLTVLVKDGGDGHAVEVHARPASGEYVVATLVFDPEWEFLGHYSGLKGGAASTVGNPLLVSGGPAAPATISPTPVATTPGPAAAPTPTPTTVATAPAGGVQAVPAGSGQVAGVNATP